MTMDGFRCGLVVAVSSDTGSGIVIFSVTGICTFVSVAFTTLVSFLLLLLIEAEPCDIPCFCDVAARNAASLLLAVVGTCVLIPAVDAEIVTGKGAGTISGICGSSTVGISSVASVVRDTGSVAVSVLLAFSLLLLNIPLPTFGHAFALVIPVCGADCSGRLTLWLWLLFCTAAMASATNDDFLCAGTFPSNEASRGWIFAEMLLLLLPLIVFSVVDDEEGAVVGDVGIDAPWKLFARSLMEFDFSMPESGRDTNGGGTLNLGFFDRSSRTTVAWVVVVSASFPPLGIHLVVGDALA